MKQQQIKQQLEQAIKCEYLDVQSDGSHCQLTVVSPAFSGETRVARQQLIYNVLRSQIDDGSIHAITMKTYAPEEWEQLGNG